VRRKPSIASSRQLRVASRSISSRHQLGSDSYLISQLRFGAVDYLNVAGVVLATFIPRAGIVNTGFAFPSYDVVWKAMDGEFGTYIKGEIEAAGVLLACKAWNNGLRGFKMRVPAAPILTSLFQALGAGPTPINFNELYSALQTRIVEGEENPLLIISTAKLCEVQKYCSLTDHVWDPYLILATRRSFARLLPDIQTIVTRELDKAADDERHGEGHAVPRGRQPAFRAHGRTRWRFRSRCAPIFIAVDEHAIAAAALVVRERGLSLQPLFGEGFVGQGPSEIAENLLVVVDDEELMAPAGLIGQRARPFSEQ